MGRSHESFSKKEVRNKREKKRKEKEKKKLARKEGEKSGSLDDMIAYVDEHGNITDEPPDPDKKTEIEAEDIEIGVPKREDQEDYSSERRGTVTFFNETKGYGFIRDANTKESIFVHINDLIDMIKEGNAVSYEVAKGQKGPVATQVKLVK